MLDFLAAYGFFLAQTLTVVIGILIVVGGIAAIVGKGKGKAKGKLSVKKLNDHFRKTKETLNKKILTKQDYKKETKKAHKAEKHIKQKVKRGETAPKKRAFLIRFQGDIRATQVADLREAVTAVLTVARPDDEVVVCVESAGGLVHNYGLAASQLKRLRAKNIPLTVSIDKIAASGGYLMACVANRIIAAPFAIVGSIGVIAQLPNFNKLLKKHNIDYEQITAGEYKRTLSLFGENTGKGRKKLQDDVDETQTLFKTFIAVHRPAVDIDTIATGEHWHGARAIDLKLIDALMTSDDYLLNLSQHAELFEITYKTKSSIVEKCLSSIQARLPWALV